MSNNKPDAAPNEEERLQQLLQQVKQLSPDLAQKFVSKAVETVKEDALIELVNKLKESAEKTVAITLAVTKKKIIDLRKAKKRNGEEIDEIKAADLVYEYEERAIYGVVEEFLVGYQEDLQEQAALMKSARLEKKREREQLAMERKREREHLSAKKRKPEAAPQIDLVNSD
jgi:hypothetical protein